MRGLPISGGPDGPWWPGGGQSLILPFRSAQRAHSGIGDGVGRSGALCPVLGRSEASKRLLGTVWAGQGLSARSRALRGQQEALRSLVPFRRLRRLIAVLSTSHSRAKPVPSPAVPVKPHSDYACETELQRPCTWCRAGKMGVCHDKHDGPTYSPSARRRF